MESVICQRCGMEVPQRPDLHHQTASDDTTFVCALCEPPKGSKGTSGGVFWKIFLLIAGALLSVFLQKCSFQQIEEIRQIARVPQTTILAAVPGEVNLNGRAIENHQNPQAQKYVTSTYTKSKCFYYRYTKEVERRDSDGDKKWVTVEDKTAFTNFSLSDSTGNLLIRPSGKVKFTVPQTMRKRIGNKRYTEYRIDPRDKLFIFGFLQDNGDTPAYVEFQSKGDYRPMISEKSEHGERVKRVSISIWLCWAGLCAAGFATAALFSLLRLHRILIYFGMLSLVIGGILFLLGYQMMKRDLISGQNRVLRQEKVVRDLIGKEIQVHGHHWDGNWNTLGNLSDYDKIPSLLRTKLRRVRIDLASASNRVRAQAIQFPYNIVGSVTESTLPPEIPLTDRDRDFLEKIDATFQQAKLSRWGGLVMSLIAIVVGILTLLCGFSAIGRKRLMENLPTSPSSGLTYGLAEVKGLIEPIEKKDPLIAPLSEKPCLAYRYEIKEKRGSGKNSKWVTIHSEDERQRFRCLDREGPTEVDPGGAEITAWRKASDRRGSRLYSEDRLQVGDPVYVLGMAQIDPERGDRLYMAESSDDESDTDQPFIISGYGESYLVKKGGSKGAMILTVTFGAALFAALSFFGTIGSLNPASYLASALVGPFLMVLIATIMHYNDLVSLRMRARRNRSNIDVALKKRFELVPKLEDVVKEAMAHEKSVQQGIAELRSASQSQNDLSTQVGDGHTAVEKLIALQEDYPILQSNENMKNMFRKLVQCENEVALISQGYLDAVETYHTRIASFPDIILAKLGGFRQMETLQDAPESLSLGV